MSGRSETTRHEERTWVGFRTGPHFRPSCKKIREFVKEITEMRHYRLTDVRAVKHQLPR